MSPVEFARELDVQDMEQVTKALHFVHESWQEAESKQWTVANAVSFAASIVTTVGNCKKHLDLHLIECMNSTHISHPQQYLCQYIMCKFV